MTGYTPIYNLPYPQASDLVSAYPGTGQDLAEEVETVLAAKAPLASPALTGQATITHTVPAYILTESDASNITTQLYQNGGQAVIRVDSTAAGAGSTFNVMIDSTTRLTVDENGLLSGSGTSMGTTSYTPAVSGTGWAIGNGTATGQYMQIGKVVTFYAAVAFGSTSTFGASNALQISLPVTAAREFDVNGHAVDISASVSYQILGRIGADAFTTVTPTVITSAAGVIQALINTRPFTWASGDSLYLTGSYQA